MNWAREREREDKRENVILLNNLKEETNPNWFQFLFLFCYRNCQWSLVICHMKVNWMMCSNLNFGIDTVSHKQCYTMSDINELLRSIQLLLRKIHFKINNSILLWQLSLIRHCFQSFIFPTAINCGLFFWKVFSVHLLMFTFSSGSPKSEVLRIPTELSHVKVCWEREKKKKKNWSWTGGHAHEFVCILFYYCHIWCPIVLYTIFVSFKSFTWISIINKCEIKEWKCDHWIFCRCISSVPSIPRVKIVAIIRWLNNKQFE